MKDQFKKNLAKTIVPKLKRDSKPRQRSINVKAEEEAMNFEWRKHPGGG